MPSARVVVADAGPLIGLARIDALTLPPVLFAETLVTETVLAECVARPDRPEGARILAALDNGLLTRCADPEASADLGLGPGEASSIALALERGAGLLADDQAARRLASRLGISVIGLLGVLVLGKRAGELTAIRPAVERLVDSGYFLSTSLIDQVLGQVGE